MRKSKFYEVQKYSDKGLNGVEVAKLLSMSPNVVYSMRKFRHIDDYRAWARSKMQNYERTVKKLYVKVDSPRFKNGMTEYLFERGHIVNKTLVDDICSYISKRHSYTK